MKLDEKIRDREIVYRFRGGAAIATELALLYYILAKRRNSRGKVEAACARSLHWLMKARVDIPEYLERLSHCGRLEEIEKLLVTAKVNVSSAR